MITQQPQTAASTIDPISLALLGLLGIGITYLVVATTYFAAGSIGVLILAAILFTFGSSFLMQHFGIRRPDNTASLVELSEWHAYLSQFDPADWPVVEHCARNGVFLNPHTTKLAAPAADLYAAA